LGRVGGGGGCELGGRIDPAAVAAQVDLGAAVQRFKIAQRAAEEGEGLALLLAVQHHAAAAAAAAAAQANLGGAAQRFKISQRAAGDGGGLALLLAVQHHAAAAAPNPHQIGAAEARAIAAAVG